MVPYGLVAKAFVSSTPELQYGSKLPRYLFSRMWNKNPLPLIRQEWSPSPEDSPSVHIACSNSFPGSTSIPLEKGDPLWLHLLFPLLYK